MSQGPIWPADVSVTVCVVGGDAKFRDSVAAATKAAGWKVRYFDTEGQFAAEFDGQRPACAVVDVADGTDAERVAHIRQFADNLPTIAVAFEPDVELTIAVMRRGAMTLVAKPREETLSLLHAPLLSDPPDGTSDLQLLGAIQAAIRADCENIERARFVDEVRRRYARLQWVEREILRLAADGVPNTEIAERCGIGLRTVETRRQAIFRKMRCKSLPLLLGMLFRAGLLDGQLPNLNQAVLGETEPAPADEEE